MGNFSSVAYPARKITRDDTASGGFGLALNWVSRSEMMRVIQFTEILKATYPTMNLASNPDVQNWLSTPLLSCAAEGHPLLHGLGDTMPPEPISDYLKLSPEDELEIMINSLTPGLSPPVHESPLLDLITARPA